MEFSDVLTLSIVLSTADCPPGTHVDGQGCTPCALGYYQPASSHLECIKCGLDQTTIHPGSTKEKQCICKWHTHI